MPEYQFIHIHTQLILYRLLKCKPANIHQIKLLLQCSCDCGRIRLLVNQRVRLDSVIS